MILKTFSLFSNFEFSLQPVKLFLFLNHSTC